MSASFEGHVPFVAQSQVPMGTRWQGTFVHHLFSLTFGGTAEYLLPGGRRQVIEPGDFLHFAPQAWQDWRVTDARGWDVYYLIVDLPVGLLELLPAAELAPGIGRVSLDAETAGRLQAVFAEMLAWEQRLSAVAARIVLNQLEYALLLLRDRQPVVNQDRRVLRAQEFLHRSLGQAISLADVAQAACLSKARLCALFKAAYAMPPMEYLEKIRLEFAARQLLFTTMDINEIAMRLTYFDRKYFDKRFKRHWGKTPYVLRKGQ